jgi:hypothetical protein
VLKPFKQSFGLQEIHAVAALYRIQIYLPGYGCREFVQPMLTKHFHLIIESIQYI